MSLDEFFKDKNIKIDLIKIDAEGSEPLIFDGMKSIIENNKEMTIICEFNKRRISAIMDPRKFLETIESYGFVLKFIDIDSMAKNISKESLLQMDVCDLYLKRY